MKTVQELAEFVGGTVHGIASISIRSIASLEKAQSGEIAYAEGKFLEKVSTSQASCVLVPSADFPDRTVIVVANPRVAFAKIARWLHPHERPFEGVHPSAIISSEASLGEDVAIGAWTVVERGTRIGASSVVYPGCYIGPNCRIGDGCIVYPRVVVYAGVEVGRHVIIHAGAVLGADGFGFAFDGTRQVKIPQVGSVTVGDDVEIGANACVDRGALDVTVVGDGAKIDNLCQIAHNVQIGAHSVISSQTGVAGSSVVGSHATIGGQVGIADYCRIDDHAIVGAQCGVPSRKRVPAGEVYWGTPARPLRRIKEQQAYLGRLPRLVDEVKRLQAEVEELKAKLD